MVSNLDVQYRILEKDKQLVRQELLLARQTSWIIGIILGALLIFVILFGLLKRKKHKEEMARLKATLAGEEQERERLARELHDGVLSRLSAVKLNFATLPEQHPDMQEAEGFREALQQLEQSIQELRTTSHNLFPEVLEQEGLVNATRIFCEKISNIASISIAFQTIGKLSPFAKDFELVIYRIVQELVQNIVKHARASHALVQFTAKGNWLGITVDDNGIGIRQQQLASANGVGLGQVRKRVKAMGGAFSIEHSNGTSVYIEFDFERLNDK